MRSAAFPCPLVDRVLNRPPCTSVLIRLMLLISLLPFTSPAYPQETDEAGLASETVLDLPEGAESQTYTFVFPLPEEEFTQGIGWVSRQIRVTGDLSIIEEDLTRHLYFTIVRMAAHPDRPAHGSIAVALRKGPTGTPIPPLLPPPSHLQVQGDPLKPDFRCQAVGDTTFFRLHDLEEEDAFWERAFTDGGRGSLDEGLLRLNRDYALEVRQSNAYAHYSWPTWLFFRVAETVQTCPACQGSGQWSPVPPPDSNRKPCALCGGSGQVMAPTLVIDPERTGGCSWSGNLPNARQGEREELPTP